MWKSFRRRVTESSSMAWIRWRALRVDAGSIAKNLSIDTNFHLVLRADQRHGASLTNAIQSIREQIHSNWRLTVCVDHSAKPGFDSLPESDARIRIAETASDSSQVWNETVSRTDCRYVGFLDATVKLEPDALAWASVIAEEPSMPEWIYFDHVKASRAAENRFVCLPDFSPEYLLSCMFTGPFNLLRTESLRRLNLAARTGASYFYDLLLRLSEEVPAAAVRHVPQFAYTVIDDSVESEMASAEAEAIERAFLRRGQRVRVKQVVDEPRVFQSYFVDSSDRTVTVIIPTRNQLDRIQKCISSVRSSTRHGNYQLVVIDNQSDDPGLLEYLSQSRERGELTVDKFDEPFNYARMHNRLIERLDTEFVLLLNNDVYDFSPNWLEQLLATAELSSDIGCVGCLLRFPDGLTQHGGVSFGIGKPCRHVHLGFSADAPGYYGRLQAMQELSAVTAALALIRRSAFMQVGGFDEERFPISYNDTDFCLKLRDAGYRVIYQPAVTAVHEESVSRGKSPLEKKWRLRFQAKWGKSIPDPFYSPHMSRREFATNSQLVSVWRERKRVALFDCLKAA